MLLSDNYKLSEDLEKALNDQMLAEFYSAYLYLSASHFFAVNNMHGFACWFGGQSKEEYSHAEMFLDLFKRLRISPSFNGIKQVTEEWEEIDNLLFLAANHEKEISTSIHKIFKIAKTEENVLVCDFLKWFVDEQLEEENSIIELVELYDYTVKNQLGVLGMDHQLSERCKKEE